MAAKKKTTTKKVVKATGTCGQCKNCTYVTEWEKLSLKGKPILGTCPYWTKSKSVLLSLDTCNKFEPKEQ